MKTILQPLIIYVLMVIIFPTFLYAQNLVLNGDLESWEDQTTPTDWEIIDNISQATFPVHGGTYSARHTSAETTQKFRQDVTGVQEGLNYTIKYYYFDNDPLARTRIYAYWMNGDNYLDENAAELRPNVYSTDQDDWMEFNVTLTAPPTADGFRYDVRVYKQDNTWGGSVFYDDFSFMPAEILPEPTNYPVDFEAIAAGLNANISWTDAVGEQLPTAYLILGSTSQQIDPPVDGTPVDDDPDLSDDSGAINIPFGQEAYTFTNLTPQDTYFFVIYPYTNGGQDIDYKTDGTAPTAEVTISDVIVLNYENFNDTTLGSWMQYSVVGPEQYWYVQEKYGVDNSPQAKMSGYSGGPIDNDDWLISPEINNPDAKNPTLEFWTATNYNGPVLKAMISTDYDGSGDPYTATWTELSAQLSGGNWDWVYSGVIDLSPFIEITQFYIAFNYTSTSAEAATWEVDEILITGEPDVGVQESEDIGKFVIYPNPSDGTVFIIGDISNISFVSIYSVDGKIIQSSAVQDKGMLDLSALEKGLYFIKISDSEGYLLSVQKVFLR